MALPKLPKISAGNASQDLVSKAVASASDEIESSKKKITDANKVVQQRLEELATAENNLQKLKAERASADAIAAATTALNNASKAVDVADAAEAAATAALESAEALKDAALARMNLAIMDDVELPDVKINLPTISPADIMGMLPSLPSPPEFPPKISVSVKALMNPSMGFPSLGDIPAIPGLPTPPPVPEVPPVILSLLKMPAPTGSISGPSGSFTTGTKISTNVIATETVMAPDMVVEKSMTVPTIIGGNIASTTTLNLAATTAITLTAPAVGVTSALTTITGNLAVVGNLAVTPFAVTAALKAFDIPHPIEQNKRLQHACLEGPEAAVYVRGKTSEGIIPLPDYWSGLVDEKTITVHLTPTNMDQTLVVNNVNGLMIQVLGNHRLPYYYYVMAERKDIDKLKVEYDA